MNLLHKGSAERLDKFLQRNFPDFPKKELLDLIKSEKVLLNSKPCKKGDLVNNGDCISISTPLMPTIQESPELNLEIVHDEPEYILLSKPTKVHTHPLKFSEHGTVANFVVSLYPACAKLIPMLEAGACHRLDFETSGLILFAKTQDALNHCRNMFSSNQFQKKYLAIVEGSFPADLICKHKLSLLPSGPDSKKMKVVYEQGEQAELIIESAENREKFTVLNINLITGVRHQIRVVLAHLGFPILGDPLYSKNPEEYSRLHLHHYKLEGPMTSGNTLKAELLPNSHFFKP